MKYRLFTFVLAMTILVTVKPIQAAPTGSDLLLACQNSLAGGFDGIEGQMCSWYVTPCDCHIDDNIPMVCLPENAEISELAIIVTDELQGNKILQTESANMAASVILSRYYPCTMAPDTEN